jgi:hypothetical protein
MSINLKIDFISTEIAEKVKHDLIDAMRATDSSDGKDFLAQMIVEVSMWIAHNTPYTDPFAAAVEYVRKVLK